MRCTAIASLVLGASLAAVPLPALVAQQAPPACADDSLFATLDFWVGEWTVWVGTTQVGTNHIAKILHGCAITEEWHSATGGEGRSLFYVPPNARYWQQVWVTGSALGSGGTKEKRQLTEALPDGAIRFQGLIRHGEREWLDRTTLTPTPDGTVRQLIEISVDGGATWRPTFDAVYRPVTAAPERPGRGL